MGKEKNSGAGKRDSRIQKSEFQASSRLVSGQSGAEKSQPSSARPADALTEFDLYLFGQGKHYEIFNKMGSHPSRGGKMGVRFAVWAPNAQAVGIIADFNNWDAKKHQMRPLESSGVWELFVPGVREGALYKYEITTSRGNKIIKSDPYAYQFELRPATASIVYNIEGFEWTDQEWIKQRETSNPLERPMTIYEVHLGSWRRNGTRPNGWLSYREASAQLIEYVTEMGFTHIQFLPLAEHPFDGSWGYQVTGYYAATSRFGEPKELMHLVNECHRAGIGVLLDWVPAHFPQDSHGLDTFDGTRVYEHEDDRLGLHADWNTRIFNYGRNEVRNFLVANALFWLEKYHIDGLRVDAVASMLYLDYSRKPGQWIPNRFGGRENLEAIEFISELNTEVYRRFPGTAMIAEESTSWPAVSRPVHLGGLGFMFKWNMGWMHDMLSFMGKDPIFRAHHMDLLTFALLYAFNENFILPLSHDEVVHGKASLLSKMPGEDDWQKFANLRLLLGYMLAEPGKKLLFMGGEIGQWDEWNHDSEIQWSLLDYKPHQWLKKYVTDINNLVKSEPALYELDFDSTGFEWIDFHDKTSTIISFIRKGKNKKDLLVFVFNFTPIPRHGYQVGVPLPGVYKEILNSDSRYYGGTNTGLTGGAIAIKSPAHSRPYSIVLSLPPLGMIVLKPLTNSTPEKAEM